MPALPEVLGIGRLVGRIEVLGQVEAHQHSHAYGYVRVAGEVGIYLEGIAEEGGEILEGGEEQGVLENTVYEVHRDIVAQDYLLYQAVEYPEDGDTELAAAQMEGFVELGDEFAGPDYRARNQLREEADVEGEVQDVAHRLYFAHIYVGAVADYLEYIEGYAYRQHYAVHGESFAAADGVAYPREGIEYPQLQAEYLIDQVGEEIGIFEIAEQEEVHADAEYEP